jgi:hypothetical protein
MEKNTRNILNLYTPSGIGDLHWTFLKIESIAKLLDKKIVIHYEKNRYHDSLEVQRLISMIPSIKSSEENANGVKRSERFFNVYPDLSQAFKELDGDSYSLWMGRDFVNSKSLSEIIPEAKINYNYNIFFSPDSIKYAKNIITSVGTPCIITNSSWRSLDSKQVSKYWSINHYQKTAQLFYECYGVKTILLGSVYEINIARKISSCPYFINLTGFIPIDYILALIMYADLIWGFQGGLSMIADRFLTPTIMLWSTVEHTKAKYNPPKNLITSWMRPESLEGESYIPLILGKDATPKNIFNQSKRLIDGVGQRRLHQQWP